MIEDSIINFYRERRACEKPVFVPKYPCVLTNWNQGLGDTTILTRLSVDALSHGKELFIHSASPHFEFLKRFCFAQPIPNKHFELVRAEILQGDASLGNGHFIQRLQRAFDFNVLPKPAGTIVSDKNEDGFGRCILHLSVGIHAQFQRNIHPRAREFYPEHRATLQRFINRHPEMDFVEVGTHFSGLENVDNQCGLPLDQTIYKMSSADWFIGLHSGIMHLAAALNLRSIVIINFPSAKELYLPALKDLPIPDLDWLYPQNVHLHEDDEGELVKKFSEENLEKAVAGEIYPFWSDKFLGLIDAKFQ